MVKPKKKWFNVIDNLLSNKNIPQVIKDIKSIPELEIEVISFKGSFIKFASLERMNFYPNIRIELKSYYKRKRMYQWNVKKWYEMINIVFKRDNYTCQYCGNIGGKLEADHIIAFSKGGADELNNLTTSCMKCNRQKKDKTVEEFRLWTKAG